MHNRAVIEMITGRYSSHVKSFNHLPITEEDSDENYFLNQELAKIATAALSRAPEFKPSGNRMALMLSKDLGRAYKTMRQHLTPAETARYNEIQRRMDEMHEKYE